MSKVTLEDILEILPSLTPEEQRQVRQKVDALPPAAPMTEAEFAQHLLAKGLLSSLPTAENRAAAQNWRPVSISDTSLADVIIEERL